VDVPARNSLLPAVFGQLDKKQIDGKQENDANPQACHSLDQLIFEQENSFFQGAEKQTGQVSVQIPFTFGMGRWEMGENNFADSFRIFFHEYPPLLIFEKSITREGYHRVSTL
jgi:hypothetical protein